MHTYSATLGCNCHLVGRFDGDSGRRPKVTTPRRRWHKDYCGDQRLAAESTTEDGV